MERSHGSLSPMQAFVLQGIFAGVVIGACLPIGLAVTFLAFREAPAADAVQHGELYLSGGNAAVVGCVCLVAARLDEAANAAIAALFAVTVVVGPCYAFAAYCSVQEVVHETVSRNVAVAGGAVAAAVGVGVALAFVWLAVHDHQQGAI